MVIGVREPTPEWHAVDYHSLTCKKCKPDRLCAEAEDLQARLDKLTGS